jgi:hypothetical protein
MVVMPSWPSRARPTRQPQRYTGDDGGFDRHVGHMVRGIGSFTERPSDDCAIGPVSTFHGGHVELLWHRSPLSLCPVCYCCCRCCCCCHPQALSLFPERVSESNLKAVNALKGVGKGTMERVSAVRGGCSTAAVSVHALDVAAIKCLCCAACSR